MKYFAILSISFILVNCSTTRLNQTENISAKSTAIEYKFELSLQTKTFLQELENEQQNKTNNNYIPSRELIEKYNIMRLNDIYSIRGFIKTNDGFNESNLTQLNISANSKVSNIITITIPLNSIDAFLTLDGINYFEISQRIDLKNE